MTLLTYCENGDYSIDNLITERELPVCLILAEKIVFIIVASVVWKVRLSLFQTYAAHTCPRAALCMEIGKSRGLQLKSWKSSLIREMMHGNQDNEGFLNGASCRTTLI